MATTIAQPPKYTIHQPYFRRPTPQAVFLGGYIYEIKECPPHCFYVDLYAKVKDDSDNPMLLVQYGHGENEYSSWYLKEFDKLTVDETFLYLNEIPHYKALIVALRRWKELREYYTKSSPAAQDPTAPYPKKYWTLSGPVIKDLQALYEDFTGHTHASVQAIIPEKHPAKWIVVIGREYPPDYLWSGLEPTQEQGIHNLIKVLIHRVEAKRQAIDAHLWDARSWDQDTPLEYSTEKTEIVAE